MKKVALYDAKPYDKVWFDELSGDHDIEIVYIQEKLSPSTASAARGCDAVIGFVNDDISRATIDALEKREIGVVAMRCAGYNNVDLASAAGRIKFFRVPEYSPNAVAEHAMSLLMCLNRKLHKAYIRSRVFNFSINGFMGFDLVGKTVGVVGTGKIGQKFISICQGIGMHVLAYDPYPVDLMGMAYSSAEYVELPELFSQSDIISLHCPLTPETYHLINQNTLNMMKEGVYIINTSRGGLINTRDLLDAVRSQKIGAVGLDVYEYEAGVFFEDRSENVPNDDLLKILLVEPNVLVTAHQAFFTQEALKAIAVTTLQNLSDYFEGKTNDREIKI